MIFSDLIPILAIVLIVMGYRRFKSPFSARGKQPADTGDASRSAIETPMEGNNAFDQICS